jgi:hypothetical protein
MPHRRTTDADDDLLVPVRRPVPHPLRLSVDCGRHQPSGRLSAARQQATDGRCPSIFSDRIDATNGGTSICHMPLSLNVAVSGRRWRNVVGCVWVDSAAKAKDPGCRRQWQAAAVSTPVHERERERSEILLEPCSARAIDQ